MVIEVEGSNLSMLKWRRGKAIFDSLLLYPTTYLYGGLALIIILLCFLFGTSRYNDIYNYRYWVMDSGPARKPRWLSGRVYGYTTLSIRQCIRGEPIFQNYRAERCVYNNYSGEHAIEWVLYTCNTVSSPRAQRSMVLRDLCCLPCGGGWLTVDSCNLLLTCVFYHYLQGNVVFLAMSVFIGHESI